MDTCWPAALFVYVIPCYSASLCQREKSNPLCQHGRTLTDNRRPSENPVSQSYGLIASQMALFSKKTSNILLSRSKQNKKNPCLYFITLGLLQLSSLLSEHDLRQPQGQGQNNTRFSATALPSLLELILKFWRFFLVVNRTKQKLWLRGSTEVSVGTES